MSSWKEAFGSKCPVSVVILLPCITSLKLAGWTFFMNAVELSSANDVKLTRRQNVGRICYCDKCNLHLLVLRFTKIAFDVRMCEWVRICTKFHWKWTRRSSVGDVWALPKTCTKSIIFKKMQTALSLIKYQVSLTHL